MMNKQEFLRRLEAGLAGVPAEERVAALQYYTEYLDDAGPEREAEVIAEIGSPEQLAADIRAESGVVEEVVAETITLTTNPLEIGPAPTAPQPPVYDENEQAYREGQAAAQNMLRRTSFTDGNPGYQQTYNQWQQQQAQQNYPRPPKTQGDTGLLKLIMLFVLFVILSPFLGVILSLLACVVILTAVPLIIGFAFTVAGFAAAFSSVLLFPVTVGNGLMVLGVGLLLAGLGLLLLYAGTKVIGKGAKRLWALLKKIVNWAISFVKGGVANNG